jgi:hypothetical protein
MTIFIVIPSGNPGLKTAVESSWLSQNIRTSYNHNEPEKIGTWQPEASVADGGQGRLITGSSRASLDEANNVKLAHNPNVEIFVDEYPSDWVYPPEDI